MTEVQSLLFSRPDWTAGKAKAWAKGHDYRYGKVDVTDNYVRLRQFDPAPGPRPPETDHHVWQRN